jgi:hypothetical protein
MSFILVQQNGEDLQVNGWTWRPTLELLRAENLISDEDYERMGAQGCGGQVNDELARRIADVLEQKLAAMKPGDRILADLTSTTQPKPTYTFGPTTKPDDIDVNDIYSASYEWLVSFKDFCRSSGGFKVV